MRIGGSTTFIGKSGVNSKYLLVRSPSENKLYVRTGVFSPYIRGLGNKGRGDQFNCGFEPLSISILKISFSTIKTVVSYVGVFS